MSQDMRHDDDYNLCRLCNVLMRCEGEKKRKVKWVAVCLKKLF